MHPHTLHYKYIHTCMDQCIYHSLCQNSNGTKYGSEGPSQNNVVLEYSDCSVAAGYGYECQVAAVARRVVCCLKFQTVCTIPVAGVLFYYWEKQPLSSPPSNFCLFPYLSLSLSPSVFFAPTFNIYLFPLFAL